MHVNDYIGIARAIITNGHPITVGWYDDGNCESGPSGGTWKGYRWGQLSVLLSSNGANAFIESRTASDGPWGKGSGYPIVFGFTTAEDVIAACVQVSTSVQHQ